MSTELKAGDTITAESLNGIAEGVYTFKSGEILTASKLNTIAGKIDEQEEEIAELEGQVEELQAIIDAFPTIESKSITANGTYSEQGKAYSPVTVNVPEGYTFRQISNGSSLLVVNNTSSDIYFSDIPQVSSSSQNDPSVIIAAPIRVPANGSAGFGISNKRYFYMDGKSTRMVIPALNGLAGRSVSASGTSTASVEANNNGIFITIPADVESPIIQYTVTIS